MLGVLHEWKHPMSFWTDLIWIGNTLYPRWFAYLVAVSLIAALIATSYGGFRFMKFLFDLVRGPNA